MGVTLDVSLERGEEIHSMCGALKGCAELAENPRNKMEGFPKLRIVSGSLLDRYVYYIVYIYILYICKFLNPESCHEPWWFCRSLEVKVNLLQNCHVAAARIGGGVGLFGAASTWGGEGDKMCVVGGGRTSPWQIVVVIWKGNNPASGTCDHHGY